MVITPVPGGPPWPEFGMHLPTILSNVFYIQKTQILIKLKVVGGFGGVIKLAKYYIYLYIPLSGALSGPYIVW